MFGFSDKVIYPEAAPYAEQLAVLRGKLMQADAVLVGAGAGLSTAAGLSYGGARFQKYFADFAKKYGIHDMYTGGVLPLPEPGDLLGVVEPPHLFQSLCRCTERCLSDIATSCREQGLLRADDECRPPVPAQRL